MRTELNGNYLTVIREQADEPIYRETSFFHALKKLLNSQGHDLVKRDLATDGHLMGPGYYLRDRKWKYCFIDQEYMIRDIVEAYRLHGIVILYRETF